MHESNHIAAYLSVIPSLPSLKLTALQNRGTIPISCFFFSFTHETLLCDLRDRERGFNFLCVLGCPSAFASRTDAAGREKDGLMSAGQHDRNGSRIFFLNPPGVLHDAKGSCNKLKVQVVETPSTTAHYLRVFEK